MYYVIQTNIETNEKVLTLFNGSEEEQNDKFYCFPTNDKKYKSSSNEKFRNSCGCHKTKFKTHKQAYNELITKPDEFNKALKIIEKYGLRVVKKESIVSYQSFHETFN